MSETQACPICTMTEILDFPEIHECVTCGHEWPREDDAADDELTVFDSNGVQLHNGDSVVLTKDLKVKGSSTTIKVGAKVKGIRLIPGDHEIDCKYDGRGILLKAMFVKKA
jgi:protein PhnA